MEARGGAPHISVRGISVPSQQTARALGRERSAAADPSDTLVTEPDGSDAIETATTATAGTVTEQSPSTACPLISCPPGLKWRDQSCHYQPAALALFTLHPTERSQPTSTKLFPSTDWHSRISQKKKTSTAPGENMRSTSSLKNKRNRASVPP